jgi:phosphodiesterase/alkaline phosphatase D-like protein
MFIAFHGTDEASAGLILATGFKPYSYFAAHLEDALAFGGPYVFEVKFRGGLRSEAWQFTIRRRLAPSRIRSLTHYRARHVHGRDLAAHFSGYRKEKARLRKHGRRCTD